ncbi:MAG: hypothetical protein HYT37_01295 [Candidatus Sungbacteria bacterium]|nr:hypothetical protein [Candidatus Sungbacteria bacterium]
MASNYFKLFSHAIRAATLFVALAALYTGRGSAGIFILVTLAVTLLFMRRDLVLLEESRATDWWELFTLLLFLVNALLLLSGLYYMPKLFWIDIPMHFWGGLVVGMWAWLVFGKEVSGRSFFYTWILVLGVVALIGVGWEFFEWIADRVLSQWYAFPRNQPNIDDVLGDLVMDLLGGVAGVLLLYKKSKQS